MSGTTEAERLLAHYRTMLRIRLFEERLLALFREGEIRGTAHVCIGQEAVAAGACAALKEADLVTSNHRGHGHLLARGAEMRRAMAELFGRETGYSRGRGGSQHMAAFEVGFLGSNGITAGGLPIAAGAALAQRLRETGGVALAFFGDGASAQGAFHEALNLSAVWKLPAVFLCENNQYAMGTHVSRTCPTGRVADRAAGYGIPARTVDGNDPLAVEEAVAEMRARAVAGEGPGFVEAETYRLTGHSRSDLCDYRPAEEEAVWTARDPLVLILRRLRERHGVSEDVCRTLQASIEAEVEDAVAFARSSAVLPAGAAREGVYPVPSGGEAPPNPADAPGGETTYRDALRLALTGALASDPGVVLLGEDIDAYGGAFRVTEGLAERFGRQRILDTPISENGLVGAAVGAALAGLRPVVELMFMDFLLLAMDQIGNHAAKFPYMYGSGTRVPLTIRTPAGGRRGYGPTHSQCFESLLLSLPGLKIYTPATVQDAYELLLAAIRDEGPVVVVEHKLLYGTRGALSPSTPPTPPGRARTVRTGGDCTIVTFSHMVSIALEAATTLAEEGIEAEVLDLRTLEPLDMDAVAASAARTQRVLVAEEGTRRAGVGAELAARIQEECFGLLDAPVLRVAAADCPVPAEPSLERSVLPQAADVVTAARSLLSPEL